MKIAYELLSAEQQKLKQELDRLKFHLDLAEVCIPVFRRHNRVHLSECGGADSLDSMRRRIAEVETRLAEVEAELSCTVLQ